jgi:hypothetical protein
VKAGVPFRWAAGDEVYGASPELREWLEGEKKGYVLAVACSAMIKTKAGPRRADELAVLVPAGACQRISCADGSKGPRPYDWALVATDSQDRWLMVRRSLRPATIGLRADSLIVFSEYLAAAHPDVRSMTQLTREHIEGFLAHNHKRPWRGRVARDQPVSAVVSKRTVIDLRCFFDDLALWGYAERPPARLLFPADIPRLDKPLPRALPPDADRDLMAAIGNLADPFARTGLTVLRGTGVRLGELLDLELDCIWDSASHGSWLKVPSASSPPSGPCRSTSPPWPPSTNG